MIATASVAVAVLALSYGLGHVFRDWAARHRLLDQPNERSLHAVPTPRTGGLAVVASAVAGVLVLVVTGQLAIDGLTATVALTIVVIAAVGAVDDLRSLSWAVRLVVQLALACVVVAAALARQPSTAAFAWVAFPLNALIAVVWIVGLTNAYNFMDGIDGLAAGQAVIAGLAWLLLGWQGHDTWIATTALMMVAAGSAFLLHNWSPARLFMGDAGSTSLGYTLAVFPLLATDRGQVIAGVVLMWPFLFDTGLTFARRMLRGENVLQAHRSHLYQRLIAAGWSHRRVSLAYFVFASVAAVGALVVAQQGLSGRERALLTVAVMFPVSVGMWVLVRVVERPAQALSSSREHVDRRGAPPSAA